MASLSKNASTDAEPETVSSIDYSDAVVDAIVADDVPAFQALEPRLLEPLFPPLPASDTRCCKFWRPSFCTGKQSVKPRLCHPLHLAVQLRAHRILAAALDARPDLLSQREPDGATLLHTLARCGPKLPVKAAKAMEVAAVRALAGDRQLAQELLLIEDSCGLRPLEACIKFGSYRLAKQLIHLPGYLMKRSYRDRGWETREYQIGEYDLLHGDRCWLSPLVLLTYVCENQLPALRASKMIKDPLMRAWSHRLANQMRWISILRMLISCIPTCLFLITIASSDVQKLVSSFCIVVHCNRATYTAAAAAGIADANLTGNTSLYYLLFTQQSVKQIQCQELHESFTNNKRMVNVIVALTGLSLVAKLVFRILHRRRRLPIFAQRRELPGDCFISGSQFDMFHLFAVVSGISLIVLAEINFGTRDWFQNLYPANNFHGLVLEQSVLGSTACFIIFNLLYFGQYMEIISKSLGKLFFTFQRMNTSFRAALPLLFYWLVMFSLVFYSVVDTSDFTSCPIAMYSAIKAVLNMVNFPVENTVAVVFHTLFFVFVGLNMLNFLIAFVNETFLECNADFKLAYWLLRLYTNRKTFCYFQWLFRLRHWLEAKRKRACCGAEPIEITRPFFKRLKYKKHCEAGSGD